MLTQGKSQKTTGRILRMLDKIPFEDLASAYVKTSTRLMNDDKSNPVKFSFNGDELSPNDLGSKLILLPVIMWHADSIRQWVDGRPFGISYRKSESAFLGVEVSTSGVTDSKSEFILYLEESLHDAKLLPVDGKNRIMLDSLVDRFTDSLPAAPKYKFQ